MKPSRVVIKLGGASLQDKSVLETFTEALKEYRKFGYEVIVVHGGGPFINQELKKHNISWSFFQGQRITSPEMMGVIEDVLSKKVNSNLVSHLKSHGLPVEGLSGVENQVLFCSQASHQLGLVGQIEHVNVLAIERVLKTAVPIIATVGVGPKGEKYNINADWAASQIASALGAQYLIFLTDQNGILSESRSLIPELGISGLHTLIEDEVVQGGMLTKTKTILHALEHGVKGVRVMNGLDCVKGLWSNHVGTWCFAEETPSPFIQEQMAQGLKELKYVFN